MGYDYSFEYAFPDAMEGMAAGTAGIVTGILLILYFLIMAVSVVSYVLNAVGMYRIAKRRGIHHAWLAWIPIGSNWLLGSISDHYQYVAKNKTTKRRKILLTLSILLAVALCVLAGAVVGMILSAPSTAGQMGGAILSVALMVIAYLAMLGLSIAILVFCYIACYDLYQSCKPGNAVLFLVLSVLFHVTQSFFVFACSGSDQGMPARRSRQPIQIAYEEPAPAEPEEEDIPTVEAEVVDDPEM